MSAVPKKKLCWNCEGNVSKEIDNCPYCGVYLHAADDSSWSPSYHSSSKEDIPTPLYQVKPASEHNGSGEEQMPQQEQAPLSAAVTWAHLKKDVLPLLLLMAGSIFFLFGVVLFLFAQEGTLTLQWQGHYWTYFLGLSAPFIFIGWKLLQQLEAD